MKKAYLKPRMKCGILFTIYDLFTMNAYDGNGRQKPEIYKTARRVCPE